jgi:hypothetical protein
MAALARREGYRGQMAKNIRNYCAIRPAPIRQMSRARRIMRISKAGPINDALRLRRPGGFVRAIGLARSRPVYTKTLRPSAAPARDAGKERL